MRRSAGFTLLEVMIAISIFALVGLATYRMMDTVLTSDQRIKAQEQRLRELVRALEVFERDLLQLRARPVRAAYGDELPALVLQSGDGRVQLEWTRAGWSNPLGRRRSDLQRVRWQFQTGELSRQYWQVLDQAQDSLPQVQRVLSELRSAQVEVLDEQNQWHSQWPVNDVRSGSDPSQSVPSLPKALRFTFEHPHYGELVRQWRLPDGTPPTLPGQAGGNSNGGDNGAGQNPANGQGAQP